MMNDAEHRSICRHKVILDALTKLSAIFDDFSKSFDDENSPTLEALLQKTDWRKVIEAAKLALTAFGETPRDLHGGSLA